MFCEFPVFVFDDVTLSTYSDLQAYCSCFVFTHFFFQHYIFLHLSLYFHLRVSTTVSSFLNLHSTCYLFISRKNLHNLLSYKNISVQSLRDLCKQSLFMFLYQHFSSTIFVLKSKSDALEIYLFQFFMKLRHNFLSEYFVSVINFIKLNFLYLALQVQFV